MSLREKEKSCGKRGAQWKKMKRRHYCVVVLGDVGRSALRVVTDAVLLRLRRS